MGEVRAHYEGVSEAARLLTGIGALEFARTREILLRYLPKAPSIVLDIGGAAGIYSAWLRESGYRVTLLDWVHMHARQAQSAGVAAIQGDARSLPFPDASADIVLLMGPLYHLTERTCRVRALAEARRVLKPGGFVFAACIGRYASLLGGLAMGMIDDPVFEPMLRRDLLDGQHRNATDNPLYFTTAYLHLPEDLRGEVEEAGFAVEDLLPVEGPGWLAKDFDAAWADEAKRARILEFTRLVEREPALAGVSHHLLAVGRRTGPALRSLVEYPYAATAEGCDGGPGPEAFQRGAGQTG